MKPKLFVGIALMLSILVAGLILIFGYSNTVMLPVYILSFLLIFFAISVFSVRQSLEGKILVVSIILVLLSISTTIFLTNLKTYYDVANEYDNYGNSPEISLMQSENDYYSAYANYLNLRILDYQTQIKTQEAQLEELKKLELEKAQQEAIAEVITPPAEVVYEDYYVYYEDDDYEREDREEEDDD